MEPKLFSDPKIFWAQNLFWGRNFYGSKFWQDLKNSKQHFFFLEFIFVFGQKFFEQIFFEGSQGLTKLEFDTEDQVLLFNFFIIRTQHQIPLAMIG